MTNTEGAAAAWIDRLAAHPAVSFGVRLREHFAAARIKRLCDCGCNSFDVEVPEGVALAPLCEPEPGRKGHRAFFEIVFASNAESEIDCMLFADARGYLASVDVTYGQANHLAMPEEIVLGNVMWVESNAL